MTTELVKLVDPTDFQILEVLSDGNRQTAPNLAEILDKRRQYMNDRLAELAGKQLVEKVGPSPRSGMYVITEQARRAIEYRDLYEEATADEFGKLVAGELDRDDLDNGN